MKILPGLMCDNAEFFEVDGVNYTVVNGARIPLAASPSHILEAIDNTIDSVDNDCLDDWGITGIEARRDQWATCNLSSYNHEPDYIAGQAQVQREFTRCTNRDKCKYQGKLCRTQEQLTGLTTRQIEYTDLTAQGYLDKEIAHKMGVSTETVKSHSQNIRIKTGLARKADLVRFAQKLNLISQNNEQKNNSTSIG